MKQNNSITIFWLSVLAIAVIGYMMLSVQDITHASYVKHEGITISAENADNTELINIDIIQQTDSRWSMEIMCDDIYARIYEYGSQLCCTSAIYKTFNIYKNPDILYKTFVQNKLYSFDESDPFCDAKYEYIYYRYNMAFESPKLNNSTSFDSDVIISLVRNGTPVMVRTTHPSIDRLWVIIIGIYNGNFVIMDPSANEYSTLSVYDNIIHEIVYFT